jgi:hypothetical protein
MMEAADMNWFCSPLLKPLAQPNVKNETMRRNDWFSYEINPSFHVESSPKLRSTLPRILPPPV